ncbi:hypothetical protein IFVP182_C290116 [Vibrio parahaemolyticus]
MKFVICLSVVLDQVDKCSYKNQFMNFYQNKMLITNLTY